MSGRTLLFALTMSVGTLLSSTILAQAAQQQVAVQQPVSQQPVLVVQHRLTTEPCLIDQKYASLGGETGGLGPPVSGEQVAPDGVGHYRAYQNGSIYCTPETGAHEIHGPVLDKWALLGYERSPQGYPTTDVMMPARSGVVPAGTFPEWSYFQHGGIFALPVNVAADGFGYVSFEVHGAIWDKYLGLGAEHSFLGFPKTN